VRTVPAPTIALILALSPAAALAAEKPEIRDLSATREGDRVVVSYRVVDGFSPETMERVDSGIPVSFRHRLEIVSDRALPLIPDRVRAKVVVETTAQYDALTRRYTLLRRTEVRSSKRRLAPPPVEETRVTPSVDEMRAWMTELDGIEVWDPARPLAGNELSVRVETAVGRRYLLLIFPVNISAEAELELEPLPGADADATSGSGGR